MTEFQYSFNDNKKSVQKDIDNINKNRLPVALILDGLTNTGNIGMIFRIADALRIKKIYLYNINNQINKESLLKKSRSTIKYVPFEFLKDYNKIIKLKKYFEFLVLEKTNKSTPYNKYKFSKAVCLIIGAEKTGVSQELLELADLSLHLPMNGINTSINVATATSVVLFDIHNKIIKSKNK